MSRGGGTGRCYRVISLRRARLAHCAWRRRGAWLAPPVPAPGSACRIDQRVQADGNQQPGSDPAGRVPEAPRPAAPTSRPSTGMPDSNKPKIRPTRSRVRASTPETPIAIEAAKLDIPTEAATRNKASTPATLAGSDPGPVPVVTPARTSGGTPSRSRGHPAASAVPVALREAALDVQQPDPVCTVDVAGQPDGPVSGVGRPVHHDHRDATHQVEEVALSGVRHP